MSDEMKRELNGLRGEVHKGFDELRREMAGMREDAAQDMRGIRAMFRRTMVQVAQLTGDAADIKHEIATNVATKGDVSRILDRMDAFAGSKKDDDFDAAKNVHRLDDHDRRLRRLEEPGS